MTAAELTEGLALVPVENIHPGPLQPRTTTGSIDLIHQLADSMRAGRHEPLLEVEYSPLRPGYYQIVCGEQRWRAAKEAGIGLVLVRVLKGLNHLTRLQKQYEENRLRADLTPADDAYLVLSIKTLKDIEVAECLLAESLVPIQPLADKCVKDRGELEEHLASLKKLLLERKVHVVKSDTELAVAPLSPWRDTERALGISEAARKRKLAVLRLEPDVLAEANSLPVHHASLIAQVEGHERRVELVERAPYLTNRQLQAAIRRLRADPQLSVERSLSAPDTAASDQSNLFDAQLSTLGDLCRQLVRLISILRAHAEGDRRDAAMTALMDLRRCIDEFLEQSRAA